MPMLRLNAMKAAMKTNTRGWASIDCFPVASGIGLVTTSDIGRGFSTSVPTCAIVLIMPPNRIYSASAAQDVTQVTFVFAPVFEFRTWLVHSHVTAVTEAIVYFALQ